MSRQISAIERLRGLPGVFRGADLTVRFQWTSKTASQYLFLWKRRGLIDALGGHSDVFVNLLMHQGADWETAMQMAMPSAVVIGLEALRRAGWITQIPHVPTIAVDASQPVFATPHFEVSRRSPAWFVSARPGRTQPESTLPVLSPAWALADMLSEQGWDDCGVGQDDIDWDVITGADEVQWREASEALELPEVSLAAFVQWRNERRGLANGVCAGAHIMAAPPRRNGMRP